MQERSAAQALAASSTSRGTHMPFRERAPAHGDAQQRLRVATPAPSGAHAWEQALPHCMEADLPAPQTCDAEGARLHAIAAPKLPALTLAQATVTILILSKTPWSPRPGHDHGSKGKTLILGWSKGFERRGFECSYGQMEATQPYAQSCYPRIRCYQSSMPRRRLGTLAV